jgi:hypothetical protein
MTRKTSLVGKYNDKMTIYDDDDDDDDSYHHYHDGNFKDIENR